MAETKKSLDNSGVDKSLVSMFLKLTPEERLKSNDNAVRTILELRNAYQQQKSKNYRPKQRLPVLEETLRQLDENLKTDKE